MHFAVTCHAPLSHKPLHQANESQEIICCAHVRFPHLINGGRPASGKGEGNKDGLTEPATFFTDLSSMLFH